MTGSLTLDQLRTPAASRDFLAEPGTRARAASRRGPDGLLPRRWHLETQTGRPPG